MLDPKKVKVIHQWKHDAPLMNCRFDPNGKYVFASSEDFSLQRWLLADEKQKVAFQAHESWVWDLAFSKDGETMISGGCDDQLIWWPADEAAAPKPIRKVQAHKGWIRATTVSPDGTLLASGGNDRIVKLWAMETGQLVRELTGHEREIYSLAFDPSGKFLLSGDLLGDVRQWDVANGKLERSFDAKALHTYNSGQRVSYGGVRAIAFTADAKQVVCAGLHKATNPLGAVNEPLAIRFNWEDSKAVTSHVAAGVRGAVWGADFHSDGTLIACSGGSGGGFLIFWGDAEKEIHKLKLPDTTRGMHLAPDGKQIATAHHRGMVCVSG